MTWRIWVPDVPSKVPETQGEPRKSRKNQVRTSSDSVRVDTSLMQGQMGQRALRLVGSGHEMVTGINISVHPKSRAR